MTKVTLFSQVLQLLPKRQIKKIINNHGTDKCSKVIFKIAIKYSYAWNRLLFFLSPDVVEFSSRSCSNNVVRTIKLRNVEFLEVALNQFLRFILQIVCCILHIQCCNMSIALNHIKSKNLHNSKKDYIFAIRLLNVYYK